MNTCFEHKLCKIGKEDLILFLSFLYSVNNSEILNIYWNYLQSKEMIKTEEGFLFPILH